MKATIQTAAVVIPTLIFAAAGARAARPEAPRQDAAKPALVAPSVRAKAPSSQIALIATQDVELRTLYRALFDACGQNFSLPSSVQGYISITLTDQPLPVVLTNITQATATPHTVVLEDGLWFVRPVDAAAVPALLNPDFKWPSPPAEIRGWKQVPRRMAAFVSANGVDYAILVNGPEGGPEAQTRIVRVGDLVPAGFTGHKPLRVTQIDRRGLVLAVGSGKNDKLTVPLRPIWSQPADEARY